MHTFAGKPKATQQDTPARSALPRRGHSEFGRAVNPIPHLQRTVGNQAVQRMLQHTHERMAAGSAGKEIVGSLGQPPAREDPRGAGPRSVVSALDRMWLKSARFGPVETSYQDMNQSAGLSKGMSSW